MCGVNRLTSINNFVQGALKANFSGGAMHDAGEDTCSGRNVQEAVSSWCLGHWGRDRREYVAWNLGLKEYVCSRNSGETPEGYGTVGSLPLFQ